MEAVVVVGLEVNGALVEIFKQCHRSGGHARFGVSHGGRRITFDRTEVALLINEQGAGLPRLPKVHKRWIDDALAVGVVVTAGVAADLGALDLLAPGTQVQIMHGHQNAPLRRLQAVTYVGQGPIHDGAHRIGEITVMQLALDLNINEAICRRDGGFWGL